MAPILYSVRTLKRTMIFVALIVCAYGVWNWNNEPPERLFVRAMQAVEDREFDRVAAAAETLNQDPSFRQHTKLLRGIVLLDKGDPAGALRLFSSARPTGVLRFPVLQYTAQALYRTGQIFEAARLLVILVEEDPSNAEAHRWLGAVYYDLGNQTEAVKELTEATRLNPQDYRPHRLLGLICTDESMFGLAVEHYRSALRLGKDIPQPDIVEDLATILIQRNRFSEALESLEGGEATATIWALRADCYDGLGEAALSRECVSKALVADPNNIKALRLSGTQQLADGKASDAIIPLQRVLKHDPHDTKARYQLSMAFSRLGQNEAATREMQAHDASVTLHEEFYAAAKQAAAEPGNVSIRERLAAIATTLQKPEVAKRWELAAMACRNAIEQAGAPDKLPQ